MTQVRYALLQQLTPSRDRWNLKVRLSRMWTTRNFTTKEVWDRDMLFIDENEDQVHASAPRDIIPQFSDLLTEGDIFHVEKFNVSKINETYRPIIDDIVGKLKAITEIELVSKRNGETSPKRDLHLENVCGSTMKITV
ncbi:hypothetical protein GIB67_025804 [Kingdonia uniflora]|uniref:Replication protein A 70 kDa DNA-binding subunit B/D first OB fold domain-containing protein n=1 Tax=Kingdonia uniflora TaxID=39325 RepID=A0A7J7NSD9_9MAGN|nr:hypothetical protein GIB67_025804 [Kingdonia uniflora]